MANLLLEPFLRPAVAIFTGALLSLVWIKNFYNFKIERFLKLGAFFTIMALSLVIYILRDRGIFGIILYPAGDTVLNCSIAYLITFSILKREGLISDILNNSIVTKIGTLSYSIYLWQQLFIIPRDSLSSWSGYFTFPINLLAIAGVAWLSYHCFEKPFLKLKTKFSLI
ncbi:hypothetical protein EON63_06245 [archaeon]|nr:MAG: hypothetical protein EON63_06245 [archaeon]